MDAYLGFAKRGFQRAITYRFQFWTELVINLLFMYIYLCVWRALYTGRASVGGYGRGQLFTYIIVSQTLITFQFTIRAWAGINARASSSRPISSLWRGLGLASPVHQEAACLHSASAPSSPQCSSRCPSLLVPAQTIRISSMTRRRT